jgi:hypothetical protein
MSQWTHWHELFWISLAVHLAWDPMTADQRGAALHWLAEAAAAPERGQQRQEIVHALEDGILQTLEVAKEHGFTVEEFRGSVIRLFLPLLEGPLLEQMGDTLRRCLGYMLALPQQGRVSKVLTGRQGEEEVFQLKVSEEEEEQVALASVRGGAQGHPSPGLIFGPSWLRLTLVKDIPSLPQKIQVPVRISLLNLALVDDRDCQPYLLDRLAQYFVVVDPPLAQGLENLRSLLLSPDRAIRKQGLQSLCFAYLSSSYFSLQRDLCHGLRRLSDRPLVDLDALCGLSSLPKNHHAANLLQAMLSAGNRVGSSVPPSTRHTLLLLQLNSPEIISPVAEQLTAELTQLEAEAQSRQEILRALAENACYAANIFDGLWSFVTLLLVEQRHPAESFEVNGQSLLVADWVRAYLVYMLQARLSDDREARLGEPFASLWRRDLEIQRRQVHAQTMRLAVWVTVSQRHLRELATILQPGDGVIAGWLIRGLLLTDRLLPIITHDLYSTLEEMQRALGEIAIRLSVTINLELYPDLFNPFLYGPAEYDHSLAALLAILNVTWDHLARTGQNQVAPYWWSEAVRDVLAEIAARPETEAETMLRTSRTLGKPNRLGVIIDRTPQELATEILERFAYHCKG